MFDFNFSNNCDNFLNCGFPYKNGFICLHASATTKRNNDKNNKLASTTATTSEKLKFYRFEPTEHNSQSVISIL